MSTGWKKLIESYSEKQRLSLLEILIERLMECEEIGYFDGTDEDVPESLYWRSCGEDVLEDKE